MVGGEAGVVVGMADDLKRIGLDSSASFRLDQAGAWLREPSKLVHIGLSIKSRQGGAIGPTFTLGDSRAAAFASPTARCSPSPCR